MNCAYLRRAFPSLIENMGDHEFNQMLFRFDHFMALGATTVKNISVRGLIGSDLILRSMFMSFVAGYLQCLDEIGTKQ